MFTDHDLELWNLDEEDGDGSGSGITWFEPGMGDSYGNGDHASRYGEGWGCGIHFHSSGGGWGCGNTLSPGDGYTKINGDGHGNGCLSHPF
jgi:hypothetical protein